MKTLVFSLLRKQLLAMAYEAFTTENVQAVFARLLTALKAAAAKTDTKIDDWILETLEKYASETSAAEKFSQLVLSLFEQTQGDVLCGAANPQLRFENELAVEFAAMWNPS